MTTTRFAVVKIGGSLLIANDLPRRLRVWLATETSSQPDTHFVLIVGGGKLVDALRKICAQTQIDDERAHWICIGLMETTAKLVSSMLPELTVVDSISALKDRIVVPGMTLLVTGQFLRHDEPSQPGTPLVTDWSVTSDSIAGRLAVILDAAELILIKSAPPPMSGDFRRQIPQFHGFVDDYLGTLASELPPVRFVQLPAVVAGTINGSSPDKSSICSSNS